MLKQIHLSPFSLLIKRIGFQICLLAIFILSSCKPQIKIENGSVSFYKPNRPNMFLMNSNQAQGLTQSLTTPHCNNIESIFITENPLEIPLGDEESWMPCSTAENAYSYTLKTSSIGDHTLYAWSKNARGKISDSHKIIPLSFVPKSLFGQDDFTKNINEDVGFNSPYEVKSFGGKLYVANRSMNQINVYNSIPTTSFPEPSYLLGQKTGKVRSIPGTGTNRFSEPVGFDSDGVRFVVADFETNRVLIWNSMPTSSETPADIVLGQSDFFGKQKKQPPVKREVLIRALEGPNCCHLDP